MKTTAKRAVSFSLVVGRLEWILEMLSMSFFINHTITNMSPSNRLAADYTILCIWGFEHANLIHVFFTTYVAKFFLAIMFKSSITQYCVTRRKNVNEYNIHILFIFIKTVDSLLEFYPGICCVVCVPMFPSFFICFI